MLMFEPLPSPASTQRTMLCYIVNKIVCLPSAMEHKNKRNDTSNVNISEPWARVRLTATIAQHSVSLLTLNDSKLIQKIVRNQKRKLYHQQSK